MPASVAAVYLLLPSSAVIVSNPAA